ncbi:MAG TPA: ABC transporter substrate-binding protein [Cellulomonas sp.]
MRKTPLALVAAVAAALSLAACSSGSSTGTSPSSGAPSAGATSSGSASFDPSSVAKDDAIAALLPAKIASAGKLVVGSDTSYAPAEYLGEDGTTPIGYDVDLAKAIAAVLGVQADVQSADFTGIIPAIGSKYDVGISSFTINSDREAQANMISYFQAGEAFAVPKGNPGGIDTADAPNNVCGKTVGVQTGTVEDDELTNSVIPACTGAGKPAPSPLRYAAQSDVTTALVGGKADVMFADSPIIAYAVTQTGGKLEQLGDAFESAPEGIVVAKADTALTTAIQKAVQKLIDDGTYGKILDAWGNSSGAVKTAELNPSVS